MNEGKEIVYCSGPLFCPEEIGGMTAIAEVLESAGYDTFLPHRDGLEYYIMDHVNSSIPSLPAIKHFLMKAIFALDVYQIVERCDSMVMNYNGRVPDEGAVAEAGIAFTAGTPLIIYKNDNRSVFNGLDNGMVTCLSHAPLVSDINKIPEVLKNVVDKSKKSGGSKYHSRNTSAIMNDTIDLGQKIWKTMNATRLKGGTVKKDGKLIEQITKICKEHSVAS